VFNIERCTAVPIDQPARRSIGLLETRPLSRSPSLSAFLAFVRQRLGPRPRALAGSAWPPWLRPGLERRGCGQAWFPLLTMWPNQRRGTAMIDFNNKGFFKLKQNGEYAERVSALLLEGEQVIDAYKSMRDGVVFTDRRIIAVNVQGLTGSKKDFTSLPYKNIVAYSVETSGTFDLDSELEIYFSSLGQVKFEFTGRTSIVEISRHISRHLL
jgi:hypothetical protein